MASALSPKRERRDHRELYKGRTPPWRDTYRRRCLDKLKNNRHQLLQRFRGNPSLAGTDSPSKTLISNLIREEWAEMRKEQELFGFGDVAEDFEEILSLMEDMQNELMREEAAIILEAELEQALEQESISASVQNQEVDGVICPICKRNLLILNKGVIFCACGVRIDTKQDCLTLQNIKQQLSDGVLIHSNNCPHQPMFNTLNMDDITHLIMICENCDYMNIVI